MDKSVLKDLSYGVYIVSAKADDLLVGCVANSIMQINSETIAISINKENYTTKVIENTKKFAINILPEDIDIEIIKTFGFKKSNEINKYENISYEIINDLPVIKDSCGVIFCEYEKSVETTTHLVILAKIIDTKKLNNKTPLTYKYYQENLKGGTSKYAPTYQEEEKTKKNVFVCKICGYRYETDIDELPDDFKCPMCGVGKEYFEKL